MFREDAPADGPGRFATPIRCLRAAIVIPAGIVLTLIVALLAAPEFIDWSRYRDQISARRSRKNWPRRRDRRFPEPELCCRCRRWWPNRSMWPISQAPADQNFASADRLELRLRGLAAAGRTLRSVVAGSWPIRAFISNAWPTAARTGVLRPLPTSTFIPPCRPANGRIASCFSPMAATARCKRVELRNALITVRLPHVGTVAAEGVDADSHGRRSDGPFQFHISGRNDNLSLALQGTIGPLGRDRDADRSGP